MRFNYNSNHIEGNTLTYGQTEVLLLLGEVIGSAKMKDLEEMKAHNICLNMVEQEALTDEPLTETFIRQVLSMPLKVYDLINTVDMMAQAIERRRRRGRQRPKERSAEEEGLIKEAKELLMNRNHMTEEEAHRYLQKCSMDSGTNLVEEARMVLIMMRT